MADCVFCEIVAGRAPATYRARGTSSIAIEPLNPVTPGHILVIPRAHVVDALEAPSVTAATMYDATLWANAFELAPLNIITSVGHEATQTVFHLHVHLVPRRDGDGLNLPWTEQEQR